MPAAVTVTGMSETVAAFKGLGVYASGGFVNELRGAVEPVRALAADNADSQIRNMRGGRWHEMKIGVTGKAIYVAPKARRRGGSGRSNLAGLLMNRAMEPALDAKADEVYQALEGKLDGVQMAAGF